MGTRRTAFKALHGEIRPAGKLFVILEASRENVALSVALFMSALLIPFVSFLLGPIAGFVVALITGVLGYRFGSLAMKEIRETREAR